MKLNLGCGKNKIEDYVNVDVEPSVEPDVVADFTKSLPYEDGTVEEIVMMHTIEHVLEDLHQGIFDECHRVLVDGGTLLLAYPEFEVCAKYWLENYMGNRDFWRNTIFGRQLFPGDYHVALMYTPEVVQKLRGSGFIGIKHKPEPKNDYNTIVMATKGPKPPTYEQLLTKTVWG